ncbi:MAG TPA: sialidase family protein, partial [Candidatus Solibacter sp.]|nr:sialidase family protein [Candidatus Solibacter sp.]
MHILSGANDYRSVDLETVLSGGAETGDAWLGLFKSFDGGFTWQSNLLPGCPYAVPQCTDSGALSGGFQAAADPVVRAGTNGMFYYAGLAFNRATSATTASSVSSIFVARYNDLNNNEQLDPIAYVDTRIVASGNSSQFLDKPSMAVDIPRSGAATCSFNANESGAGPNGGNLVVHQSFAAGNVYLAYTDFLAGTKANATPTQLMFTRSTDCGVTWSAPIQINTGTTTSQGSAIAVNPITGAVYVAWRQFASSGVPDAIMIAHSTNAGKSFSKPVQISTFQPFDQGTTGTSFRTNAYPALTSDMFGFVYVAYSARGVSSSGDARIVAAGSLDGTHWTPAIMVDNPRQNSQTNPSGRGHQIMPAMTFANGRLTLLYYDLRLDHYAGFYNPSSAGDGTYTEMLEPQGELAPPNAAPNQVFTPYIDDSGLTLRRHTLDLRVLELGIFPTITLGPSVLVSQYEFG